MDQLAPVPTSFSSGIELSATLSSASTCATILGDDGRRVSGWYEKDGLFVFPRRLEDTSYSVKLQRLVKFVVFV